MMNYVKSEFYRITHTRGIYGFTGILMLLSVLMNTGIHLLLFCFKSYDVCSDGTGNCLFSL